MLHHLRFTARRLLGQRGFTLINILGLSIGIAACLLIYLYVHTELNYDGYNLKKDRIARVTSILHSPESNTALAAASNPLAGTLVKEFPEVESAVRIQSADIDIRQGREVLKEEALCYSEPALFSIFTFTFLEGSAEEALKRPGSIVLTRSLEKKYFGDGPALGKTLICNGKPTQVTAVIADRPANSDILVRAILYKDFTKDPNWLGGFSAYIYVLFRRQPDLASFSARLNKATSRYTQPEMEAAGAKGYSLTFQLEMLKDVHFSTGKLGDEAKGNRQFNTIFEALAAFILLIALLNYVNLSTTKAIERAKEVGVRKVIGARPHQLMRQFLGESSLLIAIACLLAIGLVAAGIPFFNHSLDTHLLFDTRTIAAFIALLFPLIVLGAGLYPAFVLSGFSPIKALKGGAAAGKGKAFLLRRVLTVVQFVIALVMLAGAAIIHSQMQYIAHKDLGVDRSQVLCINIPNPDQVEAEGGNDSLVRVQAGSFAKTLRQLSIVHGVSIGSGMPVEGAALGSTIAWNNGKKREMMTRYFYIDDQFLPLLKIPLAKGRNLSDSFGTDKKEAFLVNEAFVQNMGWKDPLGQQMEGGDLKGKVVGVVRNFFYSSLHNAIEPLVLVYSSNPVIAILVKTEPQHLPQLKETWRKFFPDRPFDYYFLDENFKEQYKKDKMTMFLFNAFTALAIFISCLGLYGLVVLIAIRRTKEISIRKVLGASLIQLVTLQSKDQLYLVAWAALIAIPLAAIGGSRWLESYAWHTHLSVWIFLWPVAALLMLTLAVTGWRITRTARANPVDSLRTE